MKIGMILTKGMEILFLEKLNSKMHNFLLNLLRQN